MKGWGVVADKSESPLPPEEPAHRERRNRQLRPPPLSAPRQHAARHQRTHHAPVAVFRTRQRSGPSAHLPRRRQAARGVVGGGVGVVWGWWWGVGVLGGRGGVGWGGGVVWFGGWGCGWVWVGGGMGVCGGGGGGGVGVGGGCCVGGGGGGGGVWGGGVCVGLGVGGGVWVGGGGGFWCGGVGVGVVWCWGVGCGCLWGGVWGGVLWWVVFWWGGWLGVVVGVWWGGGGGVGGWGGGGGWGGVGGGVGGGGGGSPAAAASPARLPPAAIVPPCCVMIPRHCQPQPSAVRVEARAHEGVEDVRQHLRRDAEPVVLHRQSDHRAMPFLRSRRECDLDAPRLAGMIVHRVQRVAQQIDQHLQQAVGVARHHVPRVGVIAKFDPRGFFVDRHQRPRLVDQRPQRALLAIMRRCGAAKNPPGSR